MHKIIFILIVGLLAGTFASCDKEHPGYLFSTEAKYAVDSLEVFTPATLKATIDWMYKAIEDFDQTEMGQAIRKRQEELNAEIDKLTEEASEFADKRDEIGDYLDEHGDELSEEEYDRLYDEFLYYEEQRQAKRKARNPLWDEIDLLDEQVETEIGNLDKEVVLLQRQYDNNVAYSSAVIDQIKGTAPLMYTIAGITAKDGGDSEKFADYVSVQGGGRFLVRWDDNIPAGRYVMSLYVANEGWKNLLPDVFTIIVK